jgi:hypothetical protein
MKVVTISAQFPQLKGGACNQQGRGRGSSVRTAMCAAVRDLLRQPKLKHQRYSMLSATVSIGTITEEATQ